MAAGDDPRALGRARLSFAEPAEIDEFVSTLEAFERGELAPDQWRAFRLVRGTYGQRQAEDAQMLRVKIPQGILDGPQLHALADVAERHSRGFGHITTRQNLQFHFMKLHEVETAMRHLAGFGLTTREACGNSVRNVTACPWAGVAADEPFDVTPYAEALTRHLLRHPMSSTLPRKFKIAFEGCAEDHAFTAINDLGFRAKLEGGRRGFQVRAGGGTAILCRSGAVLHGFLPASELLDVAEAVVRVFHRLGDYEHKKRNRMKFLIDALGWDAWHAEYEKERRVVRSEGGVALPFDPERAPAEEAPVGERPAPPTLEATLARARAARVSGPGLVPEQRASRPALGSAWEHWRRTNVRPQKQPGFATVSVTLPLGDITAAQLRLCADLALSFGDGTVRVSPDQDLFFRWVPASAVPSLYRQLVAAGLGLPDAGTIADVTSCPGAETCRLAVTQSRGAAQLLGEQLRSRPDLVATAADLQIKISGCPNGCGQHHIAGLGLQGSVRRLGDRVIPQYFVSLGGGVDERGARFGRLAAKLPARRLPEALERLIVLYRDRRSKGETATRFFERVDLEEVRRRLADLEAITPEDALAEDYVDLAEEADYRFDVMEGECSA